MKRESLRKAGKTGTAQKVRTEIISWVPEFLRHLSTIN
jgi:cell division protein FtsI/penicillin-binding protein 2